MTAVCLSKSASSVVPHQDRCAVSLISQAVPGRPIVPPPLGSTRSSPRCTGKIGRAMRGGREPPSGGSFHRIPIRSPLRWNPRRWSPAGRPQGSPFLAMPPRGSIILRRPCLPSLREPPRRPDQRGFGCSFGSRFSREGLRLVLRPPPGRLGLSRMSLPRAPLFLSLRSSEG